MKIVVGMSGGVDSSVAALLLKEAGHEVIGVFMKNWDDPNEEFCSAAEDSEDARLVCEKLEIPFYTVNFEKEYLDNVFSHFLNAFKQGYTPNPDVLCNREIKFKYFLDKAQKLGAEKIATGHYARVKEENGVFQLLKGLDTEKDQSYFLCQLGQKELSKALFPIGEMHKGEVRKLAEKNNLHIHSKKDSTGICFIGERKFKDFLSQYLPAQKGDILNIDGRKMGEHDGSMYFTIGQREGLKIGGPGGPWFVADKDVLKNTVYVCEGKDNEALFKQTLSAIEFNWIGGNEPAVPWQGTARIRYRQTDQQVELIKKNESKFVFHFKEPQRAVTPGQYIVLYKDDVCLGGGVIIETQS